MNNEIYNNNEDNDNKVKKNDDKCANNIDSDKINSIKELGNIPATMKNERIQVISIIGQVEGHNVLNAQNKSTKYEHIIPQLIAFEQNEKVEGVLIVLNTVGGDVEAGLAIAEMINSISKPTVSIVIGGGHSIGVPLATSSDYSFITPSATMIVHPIRMNGFIIGTEQTFEYFKKMQERIDDFIVRTSDIDHKTLHELMIKNGELLNDVGAILIGKEAVDYKLINEVGGISDAIKKLNELIDEKKKKS